MKQEKYFVLVSTLIVFYTNKKRSETKMYLKTKLLDIIIRTGSTDNMFGGLGGASSLFQYQV